MKLIEKLCDMISEELDDAEKYARCALKHREDYPELAQTFYKLSNEEMDHMNALHKMVVSIIEDYRKADDLQLHVQGPNSQYFQPLGTLHIKDLGLGAV